ncbi:unnamed protein product [Rotaria socialis]|uniref:Uncharacterized protein n=1 Tax=Rotaria socialis TaxID=392032 RepID=A0A821IEE1_9BILA|nr:unnamed protein product [Rotaria socialis]
MGRRRDLDNDDNEQQTSSIVSRISSDLNKRESQNSPIRNLDENKMNDDDNDLLIHDTILPHRKRIKKDPRQIVQSSEATNYGKRLNR